VKQGDREVKINGRNPTWTPDGRGLVFSGTGSTREEDLGSAGLFYVALDAGRRSAGSPQQLTTGLRDDHPAFSRGGKHLVYNTSTAQDDIWKVQLDPSSGRVIGRPISVLHSPSNESAPYVLPDGRHLLFLSDRDGGLARYLYVADLDGRNVRLIDRTRSWGRIASVTPDGRAVVLTSQSPTVQFEPFLLRIDPGTGEAAGAPESLGPGIMNARSWTPDGRYLFFDSVTLHNTINVLEFSEGRRVRTDRWSLSRSFTDRYPEVSNVSSSPDDRWVVFSGIKDLLDSGVFVVRRASDSPRLLWEGPGVGMWLRSRENLRALFRGDSTEDKLGFIRFDPKTGERLSDFEALDLRPTSGVLSTFVSLTPDSRWLFFAFSEVQGDLYLADVGWR
jgi:Tol biopolymer transport system component